MLLLPDPKLAEAPGFSTEQLESLTRSVELKKQQLENDIKAYIKRKQDDLRKYELELLDEYRSRQRASTAESVDKATSRRHSESDSVEGLNSPAPSTPAESSDSPSDSRKFSADDKAKRPKHTRVHKREKELCGLVTPIFLPLLDAGEASPVKRKKEKKQAEEETREETGGVPLPSEIESPSRDGERHKEHKKSRRENRGEKMELVDEDGSGDAVKGNQKTGKSKRSAIKKSSLKHNNTPRTRRKRVSLVIDDQIVLPAEDIMERLLASPSETAISTTSNSTASLEEVLDPRLVPRDEVPLHHEHREHHVHQGPVHHSLPLPMHLPSTSPTKHTGHTLPDSPSAIQAERQAADGGNIFSNSYGPPQTVTRTYLDPSPSQPELEAPLTGGPGPIYADAQERDEMEGDQDFSTYVGGMSGSGVDDVNQAGSYGYPSSLGASYLESYMQNRPLSVRMAAAEKAGLEGKEQERLVRRDTEDDLDVDVDDRRHDDVDDDMEVVGSMEGF